MNRFYQRFMNGFSHVHRSSGLQPKPKLELKFHPHVHLKLLCPLKATPPGDPRRSPPLPTRRQLLK